MNLTKSVEWIYKILSDRDSTYFPLEARYKAPLALFLYNEEMKSKSVFDQIKNTEKLVHFADDYTFSRRCDDYYNYWLYLYCYFSGDSFKDELYLKIFQNYNDEIGAFSSINNSHFYEIRSSAFGGICSFLHKEFNVGRKISEYLVKIFQQNEYKNVFFMIKDENNNFIEEFNDTNERLYKLNVSNPLYYALSLASINLSIAYLIFREEIFLEYSKKYFEKIVAFGNAAYLNNYIGKFGIASTLLYFITKEKYYFDYYIITMKYLDKTVSEDGNWENYNSNAVLSIDRTSEFISSILIMKKIIGKC